MPYRWTGVKSLTRVGDDDVEPGEEFEPSEAELRSFGGNIEEVEADESSDEEEYTCAYGDCSRKVDGPDTYCWQHPPEE